MKKKIVAVTVGQSPRNDIVPELENICNGRYEFLQSGGLDNLSEQEILDMQNNINGEYLITKNNTGKRVKVPKNIAVNRMKSCFNKGFEQGAEAGIILCTFENFNELTSNKVIIKPQKLMLNYMKSIAIDKNIGIIYPSAELIDIAVENWSKASSNVTVKAYRADEPVEKLLSNVNELILGGAEFIVLDCISYTVEMKEKIKSICKIPVILPRTLIISALDELF